MYLFQDFSRNLVLNTLIWTDGDLRTVDPIGLLR